MHNDTGTRRAWYTIGLVQNRDGCLGQRLFDVTLRFAKVNQMKENATMSHRLSLGHVHGWIDCWLERRTRDRKFASSNLGMKGGRIFFSRVNFVYADELVPWYLTPDLVGLWMGT